MTGREQRASATCESLAELVAAWQERGERQAIVAFAQSGTTTLSYAELAAAVARTACAFRELGIERGDRVALLGPNSPDWVVAYFAVVTAGAIAVPLDPQATPETTAAALAHADPSGIVTTRAHRERLARHVSNELRCWLFDAAGPERFGALGAGRERGETEAVASEDVASLLFTSGTTGNPKAVPLTHGNFMANVGELQAARLIGPDDRVLLPLPLHHAYPFTVGLLLPLATGATVLLPAGVSGPEMLEACRAGRPSALLAVPRLCAALWDGVRAGVDARGAAAKWVFAVLLAASTTLRRYAGLRVGRVLFRGVHARFGGELEIVGCGGAKLPAEIAWNLEGLGFRVLTGYGLTETSPVLTFNSPRHNRLGSEGRPLPGVELRVAPGASDAPGEILARGPSVFAGYWHNADATAAAFTADGWFKTGDLGRIDEQGYLHVVGRSKELIVLADGKKFFPEVVEKEYSASPLLREIGVFEHGGTLAAVIVLDEEEVLRHGALREASALREELEYIAARLPPYQRIAGYRVVRSPLPRTQLGKLRRHLLPEIYAGAASEAAGEAPTLSEEDRGLLERPLAGRIWRWLRERYPDARLTLDTSPQLDLNIDSLAWVALTADLEQRFGVALRAERLARVLTLRDLLGEAEAAATEGGAVQVAAPAFVPPGPYLRAFGLVSLALVRLLVRLTLRPRIAGADRLPPRATLITPNHASYLDPLVIAAALPWRRLRRTYWAGWVGVMYSSPLRRLVSRATCVFPVDAGRDLTAAISTARTLLEQGYDVVWFPEGRRSPTGALQPFQSGIGVLAKSATAAVVPAAISGTFAAWPRHRRWPRIAKVHVAFGTPVEIEALEQPDEIQGAVEHAVRELLATLDGPADD